MTVRPLASVTYPGARTVAYQYDARATAPASPTRWLLRHIRIRSLNRLTSARATARISWPVQLRCPFPPHQAAYANGLPRNTPTHWITGSRPWPINLPGARLISTMSRSVGNRTSMEVTEHLPLQAVAAARMLTPTQSQSIHHGQWRVLHHDGNGNLTSDASTAAPTI